MNISTIYSPTTNGEKSAASYNRAHISISKQPHVQQQQLIMQHLQQKQQQLQQHMSTNNSKQDEERTASSSSRKSSASSFFAAMRPRSKSDSVRRTSNKFQNPLLLSGDRVIRFFGCSFI